MVTPDRDTLLYFLFGFFILYVIAGAVLFRRWLMRHRVRHPLSTRADPEGYIAYWAPARTFAEAYAGGGGIVGALITIIGSPPELTQVIAITDACLALFFALFFAGFNILWFRRVRALGRRDSASRTL